jgi:hypothetical protein
MDMFTKQIVDERIGKGIALLDERIPNWRERIDLTSLDLGDTTQCVLGEVFAENYDPEVYISPFGYGIEYLGIAHNPSTYAFDNGIEGAYIPYRELTEAWKVALEGHVDYPHHPGFLVDCPGCESRCHCEEDSATCVWEPEVNDHGGFIGEDRFGRHHAELRPARS